MKFSETWLREWANPKLTREQLCEQLTMAGLEVEEIVKDHDDTLHHKKTQYLIDLSITPNRGDCLSIMGLAHEVSALTGCRITAPKMAIIKPASKKVIPVKVQAKKACPVYVGRIITGVKTNAITPTWMREHLRHFGIKVIHPIVDVTNYVMLELGQPLHAFTLEKINGGINVRQAVVGEKLKLLDGSLVKLTADTVIIADNREPLAIAGVMGGLDSGVTAQTENIFLESAFFSPTVVAKMRQHFGLNSDAAYRFERGIDPTLQRKAIERATELLLSIVGGTPGPIIENRADKYIPQPAKINLRADRVTHILGCEIPKATSEKILHALGFTAKKNKSGWMVSVPARRSDITQEIDLIEEIVRVYGYNKIPCHNGTAALQISTSSENTLPLAAFRRSLCDLGYQEVITYSFIDRKYHDIFTPDEYAKELLNPMTSEMAVMRASIWPGLIQTLLYNQNRQQNRVRIFESGLRFLLREHKLVQQRTLSGLMTGSAMPEQWGLTNRGADFFDMKGDLQNLFKLTLCAKDFTFKAEKHPALHPGQTAAIYRGDKYLGIVGMLHPEIAQALKIEGNVYLFELALDLLEVARPARFLGLSKFPENRRDIAIVVDQSVPVASIQDTISKEAGELLKNLDIFDVYQGKGIAPGHKSIALALTLQHSSRTLVDAEVMEVMERVIMALKKQFNAELRG